MRRIYESEALRRTDEDPFSPRERDDDSRGLFGIGSDDSRSMFDYEALSHAFMPTALRNRAIDVAVETNRDVYGPEDPVRVRIQFANSYPVPVTLQARSPVLWEWSVDGVPEADHSLSEPEPDTTRFVFDRARSKTFDRTWHQRFRTSRTEWERAAPGEYEIAARVNVDNAAERGLEASTTVRIER